MTTRSKVESFNDLEMVSLTFASWNQIGEWLRRLGGVRQTIVC